MGHEIGRVAAVILAAGGSSRLGRPKQLLEIKGESLLHRAARVTLEAGFAPVVVVLGAVVEQARDAIADLHLSDVINERWREGLGTSISIGIGAVADSDAALLLACDQARVEAASLHRLKLAYAEKPTGIIASRYAGVVGVPALFSREFFPALQRLDGDVGARTVLRAFATEVVAVEMPEAAIDIDEEVDWDAFRSV